MRLRITEIDKHTIAHELRHEAVILGDARCDLLLITLDRLLQAFQLECRGKPRGVNDVAKHHRQVALFCGQPRCSALDFCGHRRNARYTHDTEGINSCTQFLAITQWQAEFPEIGIRQGRQHRRVDLLGAKDFGVFR